MCSVTRIFAAVVVRPLHIEPVAEQVKVRETLTHEEPHHPASAGLRGWAELMAGHLGRSSKRCLGRALSGAGIEDLAIRRLELERVTGIRLESHEQDT